MPTPATTLGLVYSMMGTNWTVRSTTSTWLSQHTCGRPINAHPGSAAEAVWRPRAAVYSEDGGITWQAKTGVGSPF
jgi:hypothetical protein